VLFCISITIGICGRRSALELRPTVSAPRPLAPRLLALSLVPQLADGSVQRFHLGLRGVRARARGGILPLLDADGCEEFPGARLAPLLVAPFLL